MRDYQLRLRRARGGLKRIKAQEDRWFNGDHHSTELIPDPFQSGHLLVVARVKPAPHELSLVIAECLQNMRSSLDFLAYDLAVEYAKPATLSAAIAESSEFPILGDQDRAGNKGVAKARFHQRRKDGRPKPSSGLSKIQGVEPAAQLIIEQFQPYQLGDDFREEPLWVLHELDRISKHRILHTVAAVLSRMTIDGANWTLVGPADIQTFKARPISLTGTAVARVPVPQVTDRRRDMHYVVDTPLRLAFDEAIPSVALKGVTEVLGRCLDRISDDVVPALAPYL